jgi:deoxycytidylate deaminase
MDEQDALKAATDAALKSPCAKSKRGVVIWGYQTGIYAAKPNAPPPGFHCDGSTTCRAACGKVAVHAEQAAILDCHRWGKPTRGLEMLHVKVVGGKAVPSGGPSCPDCSKLIVEAGFSGMWLYEDSPDGPTLVRYTADEFHTLTLKNCGLHPHAKEPECETSPPAHPSSLESVVRQDTEKTLLAGG